MASNSGDKTEKPTGKRLREAREGGQVARSRDLATAASSLVAVGVLGWVGPAVMGRLTLGLANGLRAVGTRGVGDMQPEDLTNLIAVNGGLLALVVGPVALATAGAGVAVAMAQGGLHFSTQALRINWERLSPVGGFKRLAPSQSWLDTVKAAVTASALAAIAWRIGTATAADSLRLPRMAPAGAAAHGWAAIDRLLWQGGFALLAVGAVDYGIQRWRLMTSLKMTKQEIRDEARLSEGNPEIKARVRKTQRAMVRGRMLKAAAKATVVVTNPTHFAVALEYRREKNSAPVVVAKGRDLVALRIREIARTAGVPIIENPPLARSLHAGAEVGDSIPPELFGAVAEVLAYLVRIKQLML
jgi:flagellar biosynthetic protein FlhB